MGKKRNDRNLERFSDVRTCRLKQVRVGKKFKLLEKMLN
jgi:hypothetical protein